MNVKKISKSLVVSACICLFFVAHNAFAASVYNQPFSTIGIQSTNSFCSSTHTKPPCMATFTLTSDTTFVYGQSTLVIYNYKKTGSPYTPAINIFNFSASKFVNFSDGSVGNTYGEKTFTAYSGSDYGTSTILPAGTYYVADNQGDSAYWWFGDTNYNFAGYISTDTTPPPPLATTIYTFTFSTTTATANITGYWEATTTPNLSQRLTFYQQSDTLGQEGYVQLTATTTGLFNFSFFVHDPYAWNSSQSSTTPIFNSSTIYASLDTYDTTNEVFPYGGTQITNIAATSTIISANLYKVSDFISSSTALALYPEYNCDLVHLSGCLKNAAIWLFYPTLDALNSWTALKTTLETKAPFGYFYSTKNSISSLSATSTSAFNLTIPAHLKQYIFNPFDTGIAGILWFFFIFHFYKRLKEIQI